MSEFAQGLLGGCLITVIGMLAPTVLRCMEVYANRPVSCRPKTNFQWGRSIEETDIEPAFDPDPGIYQQHAPRTGRMSSANPEPEPFCGICDSHDHVPANCPHKDAQIAKDLGQ